MVAAVKFTWQHWYIISCFVLPLVIWGIVRFKKKTTEEKQTWDRRGKELSAAFEDGEIYSEEIIAEFKKKFYADWWGCMEEISDNLERIFGKGWRTNIFIENTFTDLWMGSKDWERKMLRTGRDVEWVQKMMDDIAKSKREYFEKYSLNPEWMEVRAFYDPCSAIFALYLSKYGYRDRKLYDLRICYARYTTEKDLKELTDVLHPITVRTVKEIERNIQAVRGDKYKLCYQLSDTEFLCGYTPTRSEGIVAWRHLMWWADDDKLERPWDDLSQNVSNDDIPEEL